MWPLIWGRGLKFIVRSSHTIGLAPPFLKSWIPYLFDVCLRIIIDKLLGRKAWPLPGGVGGEGMLACLVEKLPPCLPRAIRQNSALRLLVEGESFSSYNRKQEVRHWHEQNWMDRQLNKVHGGVKITRGRNCKSMLANHSRNCCWKTNWLSLVNSQ